jgi:oxalate decarboxylase
VNPGGTRELRWYPNADECQYWIAGQARMTVFSACGLARAFDFHAGGMCCARWARHRQHRSETVRYFELFDSAYYTDATLTVAALVPA